MVVKSTRFPKVERALVFARFAVFVYPPLYGLAVGYLASISDAMYPATKAASTMAITTTMLFIFIMPLHVLAVG